MPEAKTDLRNSPAAVFRTETLDVESPLFRQKIRVASDDRNSLRIIEGRVSISSKRISEHETALKSLRGADRLTIRKLFHTLEPPRMETLVGEYDAELLAQGGHLHDFLTGFAFGIHGPWIGKAFHPESANRGVGYNCFHSKGSIVRKLPMDTSIATSMLDDGRSLVIRYQAKNRGLVTRLFGEVRQVTPKILLGIGIFDPTCGRRRALSRQIPFILIGPCRPFEHEPTSAKSDLFDRSVA